MARNRRAQSAEVRFGPALKALLICLFVGGAGVGYVCQKNQLNQLGRQKKERELRLEELRLRNSQLARQLVERQALQLLEHRAKEMGLGPAHPGQVLVLDDQMPPAAPKPREAQLAQQGEATQPQP
jgi:hypothetical protein